jgi:hypothetical protein
MLTERILGIWKNRQKMYGPSDAHIMKNAHQD